MLLNSAISVFTTTIGPIAASLEIADPVAVGRGTLPGTLIEALGFGAAMALLAGWAIWSRMSLRRSLVETTAANRFRHELIERGPAMFMTVHQDHTCYIPQNTADLLGVDGKIKNLDGLKAALSAIAGDPKVLDKFFFELEALGTTPEIIDQRVLLDDRLVRLYGQRVPDGDLGDAFGIIWVEDIDHLAIDMRQLREELEDTSQRLFRTISALANSNIPMWVRDKHQKLTWVNEPYIRLSEGSTLDKILSEQIELWSGEGNETPRALAKQALTSGEEARKTQAISSEGKRKQFAITECPLADGSGTSGQALDKTRQSELDAELDLHIRSHSETLNRLSTPVAIFGKDQTLAFHNRAFSRLWRLSEDWLEAKPSHSDLLEALHEARRLPEQPDFPAWKREILALYHEALEPVEEMWHLPDGSALRVVTQPHPFGGLLVIFEDVTDKLTLERSYNTLIAVQRETLDNMHEATAFIGSDGRVRFYNTNFSRMWDLPEDFLDSQPHIRDILELSRGLLERDDRPWGEVKTILQDRILRREPVSTRWELKDGTILQ